MDLPEERAKPAALRRPALVAFDPEPHREQLVAIVREIRALDDVNSVAIDQVLRRHPRDGKGFFSRAEIISGYRAFARHTGSGKDEKAFIDRVRRRPVRSQSGVTPLTVLTKPFPCPGRCVYCPNDLRMPKSYLSDEPGAQRAANNRFDPYLQVWNRLDAFRAIGHPTEKIELIVLGGTWSFYPESYQIWFAKRCLDAMNDFGIGVNDLGDRPIPENAWAAYAGESIDFRRDGPRYNAIVRRRLRDLDEQGESASWSELEAAGRRNEAAACRNVGFSIETRPDSIDPDEVERIRRLGCTKVQLGIQSLSDAVLDAIKRGHSVSDTRRAIALLREAGFKIQAHWMPNLVGASPDSDLRDFDRLFSDPDFRPDELKIYPCSLIESAELMRYYERGEWRPYEHDALLRVLCGALERTPRYCRVSRVLRDISSDDIVTGNKLTNFREIAEQVLQERGVDPVEIRGREIRRRPFEIEQLALRSTEYATSIGREVFLEFVTSDDALVAFLRLSLPQRACFLDEVRSSAMIREVHVYGDALELGGRERGKAQHRGLGRLLIDAAVRLVEEAGFEDLAVISAIGTRAYYRKQGFIDGPLYQHRAIAGRLGTRES